MASAFCPIDFARATRSGKLSRKLAESGHYPAIDIEASISRVMSAVVPQEQINMVHQFKQMLSRYQRNRDLIAVGAYRPGNDPRIDEAIEKYPRLEAYLQQSINTRIDYTRARQELDMLLSTPARAGNMNGNR